MVRSLRILLLLLAVAAVLLAVYEIPIYGEAQRGDSVQLETDPEFPATWTLGVPFDFDVTAKYSEKGSIKMFLQLKAECPEGGEAILSGDATGDACDVEPIKTFTKKVKRPPSGTWEFTVVYAGSAGLYEWTINAFKKGPG